MKKILTIAVAAVLLPASALFAQTDSQKFTVTVPANISITAPVDATLSHDDTETDQAFPPQAWLVSGNGSTGVSVTFSTDQAFTHTDNTTKRDVELGLSVGSTTGPGATAWTVGTSSDTTDYVNSDEIATVQVSSDGVGAASLDLTVTFITGTLGSFASGIYETTEIGGYEKRGAWLSKASIVSQEQQRPSFPIIFPIIFEKRRMTRISLTLALIALLATPLGGRPISIHTREIRLPRVPSTHSVSLWAIASHKHYLTMRWTCTPFEPLHPRGEECNASMWLRPVAKRFQKRVRVLRPFDRTDIAAHKNEASVLAKSAHQGVTLMRLIVGIDDHFCPAGKYCSTVNLTVSAL